jgi:LuxR family maltose regulon positive regulatory protein
LKRSFVRRRCAPVWCRALGWPSFLDQGLGARLTLVFAPAGYGKTTLVRDWVETLRDKGLSAAWVSLDERDNEPTRFWTYVATALEAITPGISDTVVSTLGGLLQVPIESVLTSLINGLASLDSDFVLVLDDLHLVSSQSTLDGLAFLVDNMPPRMHVVAATREWPQIPTSRWRAGGQLVELGAPELRFSADETGHFLAQTLGIAVSSEQARLLDSRAEGWIAALQMAAISTRSDTDFEELAERLKGTHRHVFDYLAEEVFYNQPPEIQDFLARTSHLDLLSGPLCDAILDTRNSQRLLEQLEIANLFLVPLDGDRRWYRYHHLYSEFLREVLYERSGDGLADLHRRASDWYAENGLSDEAIHHAMEAGLHERAAEIIEGIADGVFRTGQLSQLAGWIDALPDEVVDRRPVLLTAQAWAMGMSFRFDEAETLIRKVEEAIRSNDQLRAHPDVPAQLATCRAGVYAFKRDLPGTVEQSTIALDTLPEYNTTLRSTSAVALGTAYWGLGRLGDAADAFQLATRITGRDARDLMTLMALCNLAEVRQEKGRSPRH